MPRLIAHRGFAGRYPENTLYAFRKAAESASMIELDVRQCGTGETVVFHDETLDRVTDLVGRVEYTPYAVLERLDVLDSGEGVPLLGEAFEAVPPDVGVNVELKTLEVTADALEIVSEQEHDVIVSSFDPDALERAREIGDRPTAFLHTEDFTDPVERAVDLDCSYLHPPKTVLSNALVERAHEAGLTVNAWTVENRAEADMLRKTGVDGFISNDPDVLG